MGGFKTETDLTAFYEKAGRLLDIPDAGPEGHQARMEILDMIRAAHRKKAPLPDYDELHRKYRAGQPLQAMTFGEYWKTWRERRERLKDIRESTLLSYTSHYETHIREVLEDVRMDKLFVPTVEQVFTHIDEKNAELLAARGSDDPEVRASVRGKRPTGPVTKQRIRVTLRTVLASAEREHVVSFNAAALVKIDPGKKAEGRRVDARPARHLPGLCRRGPAVRPISLDRVPRPAPWGGLRCPLGRRRVGRGPCWLRSSSSPTSAGR